MPRDKFTIWIGIIYVILIGLEWAFLFLPIELGSYMRPYMFSGSGGLTFNGALWLIPSFILILVYVCSSEGTGTALVGIGLGIFGWNLSLLGGVIGLLNPPSAEYIPVSIFIFVICMMCFGVLLFTRIWQDEEFPQDRVKFSFGLMNVLIMEAIWMVILVGNIFLSLSAHYYTGFISLGTVIIVPTLILNTTFFASSESTTSGNVGFGFGIPAWLFLFIGVVGCLVNPYYADPQETGFYVILFLLVIGMITTGIILFSRVFRAEQYITRPATSRVSRPTITHSRTSIQSSRRPPGPPCKICDRATTYIPEYDRYYCYHCQKYV